MSSMNQERLAELERLLRIAEDDLSSLQRQKDFLLDQVASLKRERENLLHAAVEESPAPYSGSCITTQSCEEAKIRIFRTLFRGREDVYARRFESSKTVVGAWLIARRQVNTLALVHTRQLMDQ